MEKKYNIVLGLMIFFFIIVVGVAVAWGLGYIGTNKNKVEKNNSSLEITDNNVNKEQSNTDKNIKYDINNYISLNSIDVTENCVDCKFDGVVKKIEFSNLPISVTTEFKSKHEGFVYPAATEEALKLSNEIVYGVDDSVLSVYTFETKAYEYGNDGYDYYSLNVNLDNEKIITNRELLNIYSIDIEDVYSQILQNIVNTVTAESFLLTTDGDVTADSISVNNFKSNISKYSKDLNNRFDKLVIYVKDKKVNVVYEQYLILEILGMGTHMGAGLVKEPQTVQFAINNNY